jgi:hypothetical protein
MRADAFYFRCHYKAGAKDLAPTYKGIDERPIFGVWLKVIGKPVRLELHPGQI